MDYKFEPIEYKLKDIPDGADHFTTYQYKVTESAYDMKGVTKDTTEHTVTVKVDPTPFWLLTSISPFIISTKFFVMDMPRPLPP